MTAPQDPAGNRAVLHVNHANRTILLQSLLHALVVPLQLNIQAAAARIAMETPVFTSAAYATALTMKNTPLLRSVVVEAANLAVIGSEIFVALDAGLRLLLHGRTSEALDMGHQGSV